MFDKLFLGWSKAPSKNPTDEIVPLHYFDDSPLWRSFILYSLFVFEDVLDANKLSTSLTALAQRPGWHKLGARLRENENGNLEHHIPSKFNDCRKAITFSHDEHDIFASEHPLAGRLPSPSRKPEALCDPDDFHELMRPEGSPSRLADYLNNDVPQLGLHVVNFKDKTLLTLYWPHPLFDAMGQRALLDAWTQILFGNEDEVQPPFGADEDPLSSLGMHPTEPHGLAHRRMSLYGLAVYGFWNIIDFAITTQVNQMVCVPAEYLTSLTEECLNELSLQPGAGAIDKPFVSDGDVLCSWWTKIVISHLGPSSTRTIVLNNAYSMRKALGADLLPHGVRYVSNAIGFIPVLLPAPGILQNPISFMAAKIRQSVVQYGSRKQMESFASMIRESTSRLPPFFGDTNMHMITFSNWSIAKLFEVDFSSTVIKPGPGHRSVNRIGRPVYIQNCQFGLTLPNGFPIIGKDLDGNYWLSGYMSKKRWDEVKRILATQGP